MKLIKSSFEILGNPDGMSILKSIELAGRTCYKSEDKITEDSAAKFVQNIIKRGHESVLEHEKISIRIICDRGVSHEIVRHRIASYSQESTRYCNYSGKHITFIIPPWVNVKPGEYQIVWHKKLGECENEPNMSETDSRWFWHMALGERDYTRISQEGWKSEQARSILPNSLKTEIVVTMNLREERHFLKLRTSPAAHPQMREIAVPLLKSLQQLIPIVFDDIWVS